MGGPLRTLLSESVGPTLRPMTRPIHRAVDLAAFQGQRIALLLEVSGRADYVLWGPAEIHALR